MNDALGQLPKELNPVIGCLSIHYGECHPGEVEFPVSFPQIDGESLPIGRDLFREAIGFPTGQILAGKVSANGLTLGREALVRSEFEHHAFRFARLHGDAQIAELTVLRVLPDGEFPARELTGMALPSLHRQAGAAGCPVAPIEFGRTPTAQGAKGRNHHATGFSIWLAGGGIKGGMIHGQTDELGMHAVENRMSVHDLHATILHLAGIDHERLTYRYSGRDFRLTDVHGEIAHKIIA